MFIDCISGARDYDINILNFVSFSCYHEYGTIHLVF